MGTTNSNTDKLNCLAAGLITALSAHTLLCIAAIPPIFSSPHGTIGAMAIKALTLLWNLAGIPAGVFVILKACGIINGRSYADARIAAIGAILLPLLGSNGAVTAFALVPAGILTFVLLKNPSWRASFADGEQFQSPAEPVVDTVPLEAADQ